MVVRWKIPRLSAVGASTLSWIWYEWKGISFDDDAFTFHLEWKNFLQWKLYPERHPNMLSHITPQYSSLTLIVIGQIIGSRYRHHAEISEWKNCLLIWTLMRNLLVPFLHGACIIIELGRVIWVGQLSYSESYVLCKVLWIVPIPLWKSRIVTNDIKCKGHIYLQIWQWTGQGFGRHPSTPCLPSERAQQLPILRRKKVTNLSGLDFLLNFRKWALSPYSAHCLQGRRLSKTTQFSAQLSCRIYSC